MELVERLREDIHNLEQEIGIKQDENMYSDSSVYYLLNRLSELRLICVQRKIVEQGEQIMKLDTKHDSKEMKAQIASIKEQIAAEEEKNQELEFQYSNFANVYLGQDNSIRGEMSKILNEYQNEGMYVNRELIDQTDAYMFENYALTDEKMKKANSDTSGGRGLGLGLEMEEDYEQ